MHTLIPFWEREIYTTIGFTPPNMIQEALRISSPNERWKRPLGTIDRLIVWVTQSHSHFHSSMRFTSHKERKDEQIIKRPP
jgi:hypothetical protein